ncbi:MAG TPA: response regulator, partial [Tichowtungia sp.]|nr:response regulator [Tichowtungia sp.]
MAKKILIVEDEERVVRMLKQGLAAAGYETVSAPNGKAGIHLAKKAKVDLILLDVVMEGMDGFEVLRTLKANRKLREIPVFMLTGRGEPEDIECG